MTNRAKFDFHYSLLAALFVLCLPVAFLLGCGGRPSPVVSTSTPSPVASASPPALGTISLTKTTGRVVALGGGPTTGFHSPTSYLGHGLDLPVCGSVRNFSTASSFSVYLHPDPFGSEQLVDTSHGDPPLGSVFYANLNQTNGRNVAEAYNVVVTAKHCHWSVKLLFGGRALVTYSNPSFAFSLRYDPATVGLMPVFLPELGADVKTLGGSSAEAVALESPHRRRAGLALDVIAVECDQQPISLGPAQVESAVSNMRVSKAQGYQPTGEPQPVTLDHLPGYSLGFRWTGSPTLTGTAYVVSDGRYRYLLQAFGQPQATRALERLVQSFRSSATGSN